MNWYLRTPGDGIGVTCDEQGRISVGGKSSIQKRHHSPYDAGFYDEHSFLSAARDTAFYWSILPPTFDDELNRNGDFLKRMDDLEPARVHVKATFVPAHPPEMPDARVFVSIRASEPFFDKLYSLCTLAMQGDVRTSVEIDLEMMAFDPSHRRVQVEHQGKTDSNPDDTIYYSAPVPLTEDFLKGAPAYGWFRGIRLGGAVRIPREG